MELGLIYVFLVILGLAIAVAWIVLPFAVMGTKPLLKQILDENKELRNMIQDDFGRSETHFLCPYCQEPVKNRAIKCRFCLSEVKRPLPPPDEPKKRIRDHFVPRKN